MQDCVEGQWVDTEDCTGDDVCTNGDITSSEEICSLNNEGFLAAIMWPVNGADKYL